MKSSISTSSSTQKQVTVINEAGDFAKQKSVKKKVQVFSPVTLEKKQKTPSASTNLKSRVATPGTVLQRHSSCEDESSDDEPESAKKATQQKKKHKQLKESFDEDQPKSTSKPKKLTPVSKKVTEETSSDSSSSEDESTKPVMKKKSGQTKPPSLSKVTTSTKKPTSSKKQVSSAGKKSTGQKNQQTQFDNDSSSDEETEAKVPVSQKRKPSATMSAKKKKKKEESSSDSSEDKASPKKVQQKLNFESGDGSDASYDSYDENVQRVVAELHKTALSNSNLTEEITKTTPKKTKSDKKAEKENLSPTKAMKRDADKSDDIVTTSENADEPKKKKKKKKHKHSADSATSEEKVTSDTTKVKVIIGQPTMRNDGQYGCPADGCKYTTIGTDAGMKSYRKHFRRKHAPTSVSSTTVGEPQVTSVSESLMNTSTDQEFPCGGCSKVFAKKKSCQDHYRKQHGLKCGLCGYLGKNKGDLKQHGNETHGTEDE